MEFKNVMTTLSVWTITLIFRIHPTSSAPTTLPTPTTTTAQPTTTPIITEVFTAPNIPHLEIYEGLEVIANVLSDHHHATYQGFRTLVFPEEEDILIHDLQATNIPNSNGLPTVRERYFMSHEDILLLHYPNILAYQSGLLAVQIDEESNPRLDQQDEPEYLHNMSFTLIDLQRFRHRMEIAMLKEGLHEHIVRPSTVVPAEFSEDANLHERNLRNLYVLQEFHHYMVYTTGDISRIHYHHRSVAAAAAAEATTDSL